MTELTIALLAFALGTTIWSLLEQRRTRTALERSATALEADRAILEKASRANETVALELTRQRDQLASLEMRLTPAAPRGFTPPR